METSGSGAFEYHAGGGKGEDDGDDGVEHRLARFAFVREERDREVRLLFRDVPPLEIAATFKAVGATLISIAGERMLPGGGEHTDSQPLNDNAKPGEEAQQTRAPDKSAERSTQAGMPTGD